MRRSTSESVLAKGSAGSVLTQSGSQSARTASTESRGESKNKSKNEGGQNQGRQSEQLQATDGPHEGGQKKSSKIVAAEKDLVPSDNLNNDQNNSTPSRLSVTDNSPVREKNIDTRALSIGEKAAKDFLETALNLCSERFYFENAPKFIVSELRDTWLSIVEMQWMDCNLDESFQNLISNTFAPDEPVLPPKCDFWCSGALETLPRKCRESVMDPFLRDPLNLKYQQNDGSEQTKTGDESESGNRGEENTTSGIWSPKEVEVAPYKSLIRPVSPAPTTTTTTDLSYDLLTWSTNSATKDCSSRQENAKDMLKRNKCLQHPSLTLVGSIPIVSEISELIEPNTEVLYPIPTKLGRGCIKASSEIVYKKKRRSSSQEEMPAFNLPVSK